MQKMNRFINQGLTIIELMLTLAIIGILLSLTMPNYINHIVTAHRRQAVAILIEQSIQLEKFFLENETYQGAESVIISEYSNAQYKITLSNASATHYQLKASPIGTQTTRDKDCGTLTLTDKGEKSVSGLMPIEHCWR